ncbi:MAG: hypothetical protein ABIS47_02710 [Acidimicrobiales bacterium]
MTEDAAQDFEGRVRGWVAANGWVVHDLNAKRAIIKFDLPSGRTQTLYAIDLGTVVEMSVPSVLVFDSVEDVPRDLAVTCLRRNAKNTVGFWCIEQIEGKQAFSCMWNVPHRLLDAQTFGEVVREVVVVCDDLESAVVVDPVLLDQELHDLLDDGHGDPPPA